MGDYEKDDDEPIFDFESLLSGLGGIPVTKDWFSEMSEAEKKLKFTAFDSEFECELATIARFIPTLAMVKDGVWDGLCPFHEEKTPSFRLSTKRNSARCFGCGKSFITLKDLINDLQELPRK